MPILVTATKTLSLKSTGQLIAYKNAYKHNMVLTVEPGLYITEHRDVPKPFWNTGIRIEDDILVTKTGHRNLSQKLPRAITEIEAIIHG